MRELLAGLGVVLAGLLAGCNGFYSSADDWTPRSELMAAIANKEIDKVEAIVRSGAEDVNAERRHNKDGRWGDFEVGAPTPVMFATERDWEEGIRVLLANGAEPRPGDPDQDAYWYAWNLDGYRKTNGEKRSGVLEVLRVYVEERQKREPGYGAGASPVPGR